MAAVVLTGHGALNVTAGDRHGRTAVELIQEQMQGSRDAFRICMVVHK